MSSSRVGSSQRVAAANNATVILTTIGRKNLSDDGTSISLRFFTPFRMTCSLHLSPKTGSVSG
jgi:hypothetical protein